MSLRIWSRSIRAQLLLGLLLLEALSLLLFAAVLVRQQTHETFIRAQQRLEHQATSVSVQTVEALKNGRPDNIGIAVEMMGQAPSVETAKVTDPQGKVLYSSLDKPGELPSNRAEMDEAIHLNGDQAHFFILNKDDWEAVKPIHFQGRLFGYAWVKTDKEWDREQLNSILRSTAIFGVIWMAASGFWPGPWRVPSLLPWRCCTGGLER